MKEIIKPYKKDFLYSYAAGAYVTIELLLARPNHVEKVIIHPDYKDAEHLLLLCREKSITVQWNERVFKKINQKENTYVLGQFTKYPCNLSFDAPHIVMVNPSDMGNLGTIIRTMAGFNINNLAIITPAADIWHPKTIRASMGALFRIEVEQFTSFEEYRRRYRLHKLYPFMLDGKRRLTLENCPRGDSRYSLVFGNEAAGLPEEFCHIGMSIKLPQTEMVDSLNLSVAVGVGAFLFASANGQI